MIRKNPQFLKADIWKASFKWSSLLNIRVKELKENAREI